MGDFLKYDAANMMRGAVGGRGISPSEVKTLAPKIRAARAELQRRRRRGELGFFDVPNDARTASWCEELAGRYHRRGFTDLLVVGIGGSDLGAKTLVRALDTGRGMCVSFLGNPDPEEIAHTLAGLNLKKTVVNVVSKSGETMEVMATFLVVRAALVRAVGARRHAEQVVATTETGSPLATIAMREGYAMLTIPKNVGGRWSVFTPVGLFPAACAGIDARALLAGARSQVVNPSSSEKFAALQVAGWNKGLRISALMPYSESLSVLSGWFAQLWAESLGKKGNVGPTPYPAVGTTDQHSQLQLWMEGPGDKLTTFIEVGRFRHSIRVPRAFSGIPAARRLAGVSLEKIMHAERRATAMALRSAGRPNGTITIPTISEHSIGALLQFFMQATAVAGALFGVNAFNQPGVEEGKRLTRRILGT